MAEDTANGYIRWRDLQETERRIRADRKAELEALSASVTSRFDNAHNYYSTAVADQMKVIGEIDGRLDNVESKLDQQNGAWTVAKFLIGTNLSATVVGIGILILTFFAFIK